MRVLIQRLKALFRPMLNSIRKCHLRSRLLSAHRKEIFIYPFSESDIELYLSEKFISLPTVDISDSSVPGALTATIRGMPIHWPTSLSTRDLPWLYHEIFDGYSTNPSSYDNPSLNIESRSWIMDAGAAEGYFSIFALQKTNANLICIEPLPVMRAALEKTLAIHSCGKRFSIVSAAVGDQPGRANIQINNDHACDAKLIVEHEASSKIDSSEFLAEVQVTTIDHLSIEHNLGSNGLIKMDIEGFEMAALTGARKFLNRFRPALAIAVYHELANAKLCSDIILSANPSYTIELRGFYGYFDPPRPYMLFAY